MGKSTAMQSMLLLRQSILQTMLPEKGLLINGPLISLGSARDVYFENSLTEVMGIRLETDLHDLTWNFLYSGQFDDVMQVIDEPNPYPPDFLLAGRDFHFLSAERYGPRNIHESSSYQVDEQHQIGFDGRYAIAFLDKHGTDRIDPKLQHDSATDDSVKSNVSAWLGEIAPSVRIKIQPFLELRNLTLQYEFEHGRKQTGAFNAKNVGFGLSYVLPILVALIATPRQSVVFMENPEAHLHPRAQTAMGRLISLASQTGLQTIVETHSDHLLNGIRLTAKVDKLKAEDVSICYFSRSDNGLEHVVEFPTLLQNGRIDNWPLGFFDEWERSLDALLE